MNNIITVLEAQVGVKDPSSLQNDHEYYTAVVGRLMELRKCLIATLDETGRFGNKGMRMNLPFEEVEQNVVYHGNLERSSELRRGDEGTAMMDDLRAQCNTERHSRTVDVKVQFHFSEDVEQPGLSDSVIQTVVKDDGVEPGTVLDEFEIKRAVDEISLDTLTGASFIFKDYGPGFNPEDVPDPTAEENLEKSTGRGLLLMRAFSDGVAYNEKGDEVTFQVDVVEEE